jgi:hypothetical protein
MFPATAVTSAYLRLSRTGLLVTTCTTASAVTAMADFSAVHYQRLFAVADEPVMSFPELSAMDTWNIVFRKRAAHNTSLPHQRHWHIKQSQRRHPPSDDYIRLHQVPYLVFFNGCPKFLYVQTNLCVPHQMVQHQMVPHQMVPQHSLKARLYWLSRPTL